MSLDPLSPNGPRSIQSAASDLQSISTALRSKSLDADEQGALAAAQNDSIEISPEAAAAARRGETAESSTAGTVKPQAPNGESPARAMRRRMHSHRHHATPSAEQGSGGAPPSPPQVADDQTPTNLGSL